METGPENSKSETSLETQESAQTCPIDNSWIHDGWNPDEWSFDEWNDDKSSVGWHEGWEHTYGNSASSFSMGGLDLGATSSPKRLQCKQCSTVGKRVWQSSALVSPTKTLKRDVTPIGDGIEPVGESRADVEMGNEEDEEPLEAEIPRIRMSWKNPTNREKQEHEDSGHAVYRSWCAACVEGRGLGGQHRIEPLWRKKKEKKQRRF